MEGEKGTLGVTVDSAVTLEVAVAACVGRLEGEGSAVAAHVTAMGTGAAALTAGTKNGCVTGRVPTVLATAVHGACPHQHS